MPETRGVVCLYLAKFGGQLCIATSNGYLCVPADTELVIDHNHNWNYYHIDNWHAYQPLDIEDRNAIKYLPDWELAAEITCGSEIGQLYLHMKEQIKNLGGI